MTSKSMEVGIIIDNLRRVFQVVNEFSKAELAGFAAIARKYFKEVGVRE